MPRVSLEEDFNFDEEGDADDTAPSPDNQEENPDDQDDGSAVDVNAPTELADTSDLAVDKLKELNEADDESAKQVQTEFKRVGELSDDLQVAYYTFESFQETFQLKNIDTGREVAQLRRLGRKYGLEELRESLDGVGIYHDREVAVEGFKEVFQAIWKAISEAIKKVLEFIRKAYAYFFKSNDVFRKATNKTQLSLIELRKQHGRAIQEYIDANNIDESRFVLGEMMTKRVLSLEGRFFTEATITAYDANGNKAGTVEVSATQLLDRSIDLLSRSRFFTSDAVRESLDAIRNLKLPEEWLGRVDFSDTPLKFAVSDLLPAGYHRVSRVGNICVERDQELYVADGYLNDAYAVVLLGEFHGTTKRKDLLRWGDFKATVSRYDTSVTTDAMPRLSTDEILTISKKMNELFDASEAIKEVYQEFEKVVFDIENNIMPRLKERVAVDNEIAFKRMGLKSNAASYSMMLLKYMLALITSGNSFMQESAAHVLLIQRAWATYLAALRESDAEIVRKLK